MRHYSYIVLQLYFVLLSLSYPLQTTDGGCDGDGMRSCHARKYASNMLLASCS